MKWLEGKESVVLCVDPTTELTVLHTVSLSSDAFHSLKPEGAGHVVVSSMFKAHTCTMEIGCGHGGLIKLD